MTNPTRVARHLVAVSALVLVLSGCNWAMFRSDSARSGFAPFESTITADNVASVASSWTAATAGAVASSPSVVDGVVYVGSNDGKLYAFDAKGVTNCTATMCAPLWTATVWGYPKAVDALVRAGARVDNLVLAAASGDVTRVDAMLSAPRRDLPIPYTDKTLPAAHALEYALIYAANLDRRDVVARLLALSPDLSVRDPIWDATVRSVAEHHGHREIVALLP